MIIIGGEPPFIEQPEPEFGEVILKLNEMVYNVEQSVHSFNDGTKEALILFSQNLAGFISDVVLPINTHLGKVGAVHGETKSTIGLSKKDNYRTGTLAEQANLSAVQAYVTPQGAKQAFINRNRDNPFVRDDYQANDLLQMASYYYVNEFPVTTPTVIQGTRYLESNAPVAMIINDDRIVYSPSSKAGAYQTEIGFISSPTQNRKSSRLSEILNLYTKFLPAGWNNVGAVTPSDQVSIFKPLADKQIFLYKNELGLPVGGKNFLLLSSYIGTVYTGFAVYPQVVDDFQFGLLHKFFKVDAFETDPTLRELVDGTYPALFTLMGQPPYQGLLQSGHTYDIRNFVTLHSDQNIKIAAENGEPKVTVALFWAVEDFELRANISVPVVIENTAGGRKYLIINFMLSIIPGSLVPGGAATVTVLGNRIPDTINIGMTPVAGSNYTAVTDTWDFNCPSNLPGVVLDSGDILRSISMKNGVRIKRYSSGFAGLQAWLQGPRTRVDARSARTEMFSPSRHSPFGGVPERIIPITNLNGTTTYLVYGLDNEKGYYHWVELNWNTESLIGAVDGSHFGIKHSTRSTPYPNLDSFPRGLTIYGSKNSAGFGFNSLVFTTENGYKAPASFSYSEGTVTLGADVTLSPATLIQLQALGAKVMTNAEAFNPGIPDNVREMQIQVYGLHLGKAVIVISDGYSYAEGGAVPYTVSNGVFQLNFTGSSGVSLLRLTPPSNTLVGANRVSKSGDGVWSSPSDLLASRIDPNTYDIVITRPFGEVYGDLSFSLGLLSSNIPVITPGFVNPARLFNGVSTIDAVDELHPPILLPNKGVYQVDPTSVSTGTPMKEVGGISTVDPYEVNEAGWVRIPAGSKVLILGRVYMLDRDYPVKVNVTGISYCYLQRLGDGLVAIAADVMREVNNGEVMFGISRDGILTVNESYIVMDKHVLSATRHGSSIPVFDDNGGLGVNEFFTQRDIG